MRKEIYGLLLFSFFAMISNYVQGQTLLSDSLRIEKIISKQINNDLRGQIIVVKDPTDVAFLSAYIDKTKTHPSQRERVHIINDRKTIGGRYKQGDATVLQQVLEILNSEDYHAIDEFLEQMKQEFDDSLRPYTLNDAVKSKLFELIAVPELESSIIYYLDRQKIEGRTQLFETRLFSDKSTQTELLIEKLCEEKSVSDKVANYFSKTINQKKPNFSTSDILPRIYEKSSPVAQKELINELYTYLDKNPFQPEEFSSIEISTEETDTIQVLGIDEQKHFKKQVLYQVLGSNDKRNLALINKLKELSNHEILKDQNAELEYLITNAEFSFLDLSKRKQILLDKMKERKTYSDSFSDFFSDEEIKNDSQLQVSLLQNGETLGFFEKDYWIAQIKSAFSYLDSKSFTELVQNSIKSSETRNVFLVEYFLLDIKTKWLAENGFKTKTLTNQQKSDFLNDIREDKRSNIFTAMELNEIGVSLEPEHIKQTENYNVLFEKFINLSGGKIKEVKSCIQYIYDEYFNKSGPRVFISYKDKCYILIPEQYSEFSELGLIRLVLDQIVEESGITEKYYFLDLYRNADTYGEYSLFGEAQLIEKLTTKFEMDISRNPQDDYR
ncbi:hypothetical protein WMW71_01930 [Flavobacterium buctense]|uniref:Peptidylprolyl isomerase n=1 Tax=Flavobacterium buctense TaxID=1648146 RepID=A0ABU9E0J7_9FLAO|nr:hypothetical protein [Flavobacterium buctense]